MSEEKPVLSVRGVVNRFGTHTVHDGADLDVWRGEIMGLVGGSGSGKSVLLRTIVGLHRPTAGEVRIAGRDITAVTPAEKAATFGVLFQQGALFSSLTVVQNVMVPLKEHTKLPDVYDAAIARLKISLAGLPQEAGDKYPSQLSGGMIKRAALARALALDPPILFLDEPTAGLDPIGAAEFDALILSLRQNLGVTVVMVTHDLDTLFSVCDRVAVLVDRRIVVDTLPNLLNNPHPWIREYFQGPRARAAQTLKDLHGAG